MSDLTPAPLPADVDLAILGAGPAGCSAASWLAQLGHRVALIERGDQPCAALQSLRFPQHWVLGEPGESLATLGQRYAAQVRGQTGVHLVVGQQAVQLDWLSGEGWQLRLDDGRLLRCRALMLATGLRPLLPGSLYPRPAQARVLDSIALATQRSQLPRGRTLLLGAGDNAAENALFLHEQGHQVTLWSRGDWRAQQALVERIHALAPAIALRLHTPVPTQVVADAQGVSVHSSSHGHERFDHVAVLLGFEPEPSAWLLVGDALQRAGISAPSQPLRDEARFAQLGLFVAGDASARQHPCVQTALGDGVVAAKRVQEWLQPPRENQAPPALRRNNRQVIHISGLRFGANLGLLDFEREGPQPIQVDAEINLGAQMIVSRDADIGHVLDYRRIRSIIIEECTAEHTDLLEAMLGKLCTRLMKLAGVVGVRIKVTKLEIFPDCQVAISAECGQW